MPQVLIHPEGGNPGEAGLVGGGAGEDRLDAGPHGPPRGGQLPSQSGDAGMLASDLFGRPAARPGGQHRPRVGDPGVLLGEHPYRTGRFGTRPRAFAPTHACRGAEAGDVDQGDRPSAMAAGHHPAGRAAHHRWWGLDLDHQPGRSSVHIDDVHAGQADETVTVVAVGVVMGAARSTRRRLRHSRGPRWIRSLVTPDPEGPDPYLSRPASLGVSAPHPPQV